MLVLLDACQPAYSFLQVIFLMGCDTITDLYLMAIPIPVRLNLQVIHCREFLIVRPQIIWNARLDIKRKVYLLILFSLGWGVIIFSIVRCILLVTVGQGTVLLLKKG